MHPYILAIIFIAAFIGFATVVIIDVLDSDKEDESQLAIKEALEMQTWEARKQRFAQAGIR